MSRTGADCIVANCDQWFIDYADKEWTETVKQYCMNELKFPIIKRGRLQDGSFEEEVIGEGLPTSAEATFGWYTEFLVP